MLRTQFACVFILRVLATAGGALGVIAAPSTALAGPPFQTDDPEPVDLGHYEFYVFGASDSTPLETDPVGPAFEFNWGALPNTQLHGVLNFGAVIPSDNSASAAQDSAPSAYGLLDTELGVKYRFIAQSDTIPEVGIFPMIELPTGNSSRGLGVGKTWYKLPLWIQKEFGPWTTYGGGGYEIVRQDGFRDFRYAGWLLQRDLGEEWTLGGELWYHGPEGAGTPLPHSATMVDLGGYYYFRKPDFQLLFSVGHTAVGQSEIYAYLGLYWTWGKKDAGSAPPPVAWSMTTRAATEPTQQ